MSEPRKKILVAATRRAREGSEVSMRSIATELNVTPMSIYRHFHDKEALLETIVETGFAILTEHLQRRTSRNRRVLGVMSHFLDFALAEPRLYELMFLQRRAKTRVYPGDFATHRSTSFDVLRKAVVEEIGDGRMRRDDALEVTLTIWSHAHGMISMYTLGRFGDDAAAFRKLYNRVLRRLLRGLASPGETR
jgi:AcrR family transcriptional regulator